jgi:RNA polymerase II-associated protein 2
MTSDRHRETAIKHARIIEDQKRVKEQVIDLIVECFDLPSTPQAVPTTASAGDVRTFKKALSLFQADDFDELTSERNIDDRCGYALCSRPNQKHAGGGNKVWNHKRGKDFKLINRREVERYCSSECEGRGVFVRSQLSSEPAWTRDVTETAVVLLDDVQEQDDLATAIKQLTLDETARADLSAKMKELSLERGDGSKPQPTSLEVAEREVSSDEVPLPPDPGGLDSIEGHNPRKVRFAAGAD